MKTVAQIVSEYKKQQVNPEYEMVTVLGIDGIPLTFSNVNNIEQSVNNDLWLEFDSESKYTKGIKHVRVLGGRITKYITRTND